MIEHSSIFSVTDLPEFSQNEYGGVLFELMAGDRNSDITEDDPILSTHDHQDMEISI